MRSWKVVEPDGPASAHHLREMGASIERTVRVIPIEGRTLVLGSTQPDDTVDRPAALAAGVEVVRRRSGGGAVLLEPGDVAAWIDLEIPVSDPLWDDDVGRAAHVIGDVWSRALASLGIAAAVHHGPLERSPLGRLVCFAALGPGEVTVDGRKAVGLAQRRTASGARFQTVLLRRWRPERLVDLLHLDGTVADPGPFLARRAAGLDLATSAVVGAVLANLPE